MICDSVIHENILTSVLRWDFPIFHRCHAYADQIGQTVQQNKNHIVWDYLHILCKRFFIQ